MSCAKSQLIAIGDDCLGIAEAGGQEGDARPAASAQRLDPAAAKVPFTCSAERSGILRCRRVLGCWRWPGMARVCGPGTWCSMSGASMWCSARVGGASRPSWRRRSERDRFALRVGQRGAAVARVPAWGRAVVARASGELDQIWAIRPNLAGTRSMPAKFGPEQVGTSRDRNDDDEETQRVLQERRLGKAASVAHSGHATDAGSSPKSRAPWRRRRQPERAQRRAHRPRHWPRVLPLQGLRPPARCRHRPLRRVRPRREPRRQQHRLHIVDVGILSERAGAARARVYRLT